MISEATCHSRSDRCDLTRTTQERQIIMNTPSTKHMYSDNWKPRSHDIAYTCFAFSGGVAFLMGVLSFIPMDAGVSGGIGILIGAPLSIAAIAAMIVGLLYSIIHYKHWPFIVMSIASILFILEMITELGPVAVYNISPIIYGIITSAFGILWVTRLRRNHT